MGLNCTGTVLHLQHRLGSLERAISPMIAWSDPLMFLILTCTERTTPSGCTEETTSYFILDTGLPQPVVPLLFLVHGLACPAVRLGRVETKLISLQTFSVLILEYPEIFFTLACRLQRRLIFVQTFLAFSLKYPEIFFYSWLSASAKLDFSSTFFEKLGPGTQSKVQVQRQSLGPKHFTKFGLPTPPTQTFRRLLRHLGV